MFQTLRCEPPIFAHLNVREYRKRVKRLVRKCKTAAAEQLESGVLRARELLHERQLLQRQDLLGAGHARELLLERQRHERERVFARGVALLEQGARYEHVTGQE